MFRGGLQHVPNRLLVLGRPGYYGTQMHRGPPEDADARGQSSDQERLGRRSRDGTSDESKFTTQFGKRIQALSTGHDLLVKSAWKNVPLGSAIEL
jgi:HWE histidine kinase